MPKLPILERLEAKLAETKALVGPKELSEEDQKWLDEKRRVRERQIQEDEIMLSRARILAHELKNGPGIFDIPKDIPPYTPPVDAPISDRRSALLEKVRQLMSRPREPILIPPPLKLQSPLHGYTNYALGAPGHASSSFTPSRSAHSTHPRVDPRFRRTTSNGSTSISLGIERYRRERYERAEAEAKRKEEEKRKAKKEKKLQKEKENQRVLSIEDDEDVVCLD
jgi:hypothetical protein